MQCLRSIGMDPVTRESYAIKGQYPFKALFLGSKDQGIIGK